MQEFKRIQFQRQIEAREDPLLQFDGSHRSSDNTSNQLTANYDFLKLSNSKGSASRFSGSRVSKGPESSQEEKTSDIIPHYEKNLLSHSPQAVHSQGKSKIFEQYREHSKKQSMVAGPSEFLLPPGNGSYSLKSIIGASRISNNNETASISAVNQI